MSGIDTLRLSSLMSCVRHWHTKLSCISCIMSCVRHWHIKTFVCCYISGNDTLRFSCLMSCIPHWYIKISCLMSCIRHWHIKIFFLISCVWRSHIQIFLSLFMCPAITDLDDYSFNSFIVEFSWWLSFIDFLWSVFIWCHFRLSHSMSIIVTN